MLDTVTLDEKAAAFAMTDWHDQLYLAWIGTDLNLNVAWSPDAREVMDIRSLDQRSSPSYIIWTRHEMPRYRTATAPALAGSGEHLYLAWMAANQRLAGLIKGLFSDARHISILTDPQSPYDAPTRLVEASSCGAPALCSHQGSVVLAWMGTDGCINILTDPQSPHDPPIRLEEEWWLGALCSHQGSLVLAWADDGGDIFILTDPQSPHGAPIRPGKATTPLGRTPAMCSHQGSLVVAWTGTDGHINILTDPQSPHGAPIRLKEARSPRSPALCSHQGSLILAWSGHDYHLNLARLQ
jgi:hypothetical protein